MGFIGGGSPPYGDAIPANVLAPKTFGNTDGKQTGTMPDKTGTNTLTTWTNSTSDTEVEITVPAGFYVGGQENLKINDNNLVAANVMAGVAILGVNGTGTADANAAASDIALSKTAYVGGVKVTGTNSGGAAPTGTAVTSDVLAPKTFMSAASGTEQTGTMVNNGALGTITPSTANQNIPAGFTSGGTVAGDADLVAGNIKSGVDIFGVTGNVIQATGTATASQILSGATASNSSGSLTGTMVNNGSLGTITPTTTNQTIPSGFTSGGTVAGDADLVANNIKNGISIFGVTGNLSPTGTFQNNETNPTLSISTNTATQHDFNFSITGLSFVPEIILIRTVGSNITSNTDLTLTGLTSYTKSLGTGNNSVAGSTAGIILMSVTATALPSFNSSSVSGTISIRSTGSITLAAESSRQFNIQVGGIG